MKIEITPRQQAKIYEWLWNVVYPELVSYEQQVTAFPTPEQLHCWEQNRPYNIDVTSNLILVSLTAFDSNSTTTVPAIANYQYSDDKSYVLYL